MDCCSCGGGLSCSGGVCKGPARRTAAAMPVRLDDQRHLLHGAELQLHAVHLHDARQDLRHLPRRCGGMVNSQRRAERRGDGRRLRRARRGVRVALQPGSEVRRGHRLHGRLLRRRRVLQPGLHRDPLGVQRGEEGAGGATGSVARSRRGAIRTASARRRGPLPAAPAAWDATARAPAPSTRAGRPARPRPALGRPAHRRRDLQRHGDLLTSTPLDCSPNQCTTAGNGGCTSGCTGDGNCGPNGYCVGGNCALKGNAGATCTATDQCLSGFCVDGFCCNTGVPNGSRLARAAPRSRSRGRGRGPAGTPSRGDSRPAQSCTGSTLTNAKTCNSSGACSAGGGTTPPAASTCNAGMTACDSSLHH